DWRQAMGSFYERFAVDLERAATQMTDIKRMEKPTDFICEKCSQLVEFRNEEISSVLERVSAEHGFRMKGHRLEVHGICDACARPPVRRHRKLDMI
ncbi:MAG: transcriptional repressor, partial [Planctomyces sp.]